MVFNPQIEGGTRFEQPVSPPQPAPSVFASLAGVAGGFIESWADSRQQGDGTPNNEQDRFNASWRAYAEGIGSPSITPSTATSSQLAGFERWDPARFDTAISLAEQAGAEGFTAERTERDAFNEFRNSDLGFTYQARAVALHPDDTEAQETYFLEQYALERQRAARHAELERESQATTFRGNISDEAWDIELDSFRNVATDLAIGLRDLGHELVVSGRVDIGDQFPEIAQLTGTRVLTMDNLSSAVETLRANLTTQLTRQLRAGYPGRHINSPDDEYLNQVFAPLTAVMDAVLSETNPTQRLERLQDSSYLNLWLELSETSQAALTMYDRFGDNPLVRDRILTNAEVIGRIENEVSGILEGRQLLDPVTIDRMSADDAEVTLDVLLAAGVAAAEGNSQQEIDDLSGFVGSLNGLVRRIGGAFDTDVYEFLATDSVRRALSTGVFGEEATAQVSQMVQYDLGQEFNALRQEISNTAGSLALVNGQLVFTNPDRVTVEGQTMPGIPLSRNGQRILERINEKLSIFGVEADEGILGATIEELFSADANVAGQDISGGLVQMPEAQETNPNDPTGMANPISTALTGATTFSDSPQAGSTDVTQSNTGILDSLARTESSGRFEAFNRVAGAGGEGHFGRLQFSRARLQDAARAGVIPEGTSPEEFLANTAMQQRVEQWHLNDYRTRINEDFSDVIGTTIRGVPITTEGLIAVAHLGGYEGMRRFVESGGSYNPQDAYGTTLMEYAVTHGGVGAGSVTLTAPSNGTQIAENVWVNPRMNPLVTMDGASAMTQSYAEENMSRLLQGPFQQLQQLFGAPVLINDAIAREGTTRETQTPGSQHFHGNALDLDITSMSTEEQLRLVRAAYAAGFRGFGFGQNILHIDMGGNRSWAYGNGTFAGLPLAEVQAMVTSGEFPSDYGMTDQGVAEAWAADAMNQNAAPEYDDAEGSAPSNFEVYNQTPTLAQPQEVEQQEGDAIETPEQQSRGPSVNRETLEAARVPQEITDMIATLTGQGDDEALAALEEFLRQRITAEGRGVGPR